MIGNEPVRLIQYEGGHLPTDELEPLGHGGDDGIGHLPVVEPGGPVGERSRGAGVPVELECSVDRDQDIPDPLPIVDHHHASHMSRPANHPLAYPHHFDPTPHVDRPLTRAVLATELSDARVDPEALEGIHHDPGNGFEPIGYPCSRLLLWRGPREGECVLVEHSRPSAGQTFDRSESIGVRGTDRIRVAGLDTIDHPECHHGLRDVKADETVDFATGDSSQCGVAHRNVECRVIGIGIGHEGVSAHNQEDKEPSVTVSGSILRLGIRPICGEPASLEAR
jgi:hypothetical protein